MSLDAALVFTPDAGWHLQPSPELEQLVINQAPPRYLREHHMTTATDLGTCCWASCNDKATIHRQDWNFCATHDAEDQALEAEEDEALDEPSATVTPLPSAPSSIARLLEDATGHSRAGVKNLARKIETDLDRLRSLIAQHALDEQAKQQAARKRAQQKAEVARLEQLLRDAKASLRGPGVSAATRTVPPADGTYDCRKCGKPLATAQGRGNHEKHCQGGGSA